MVKLSIFTYMDIKPGSELCQKKMRGLMAKKKGQGNNEEDLKGKKEVDM